MSLEKIRLGPRLALGFGIVLMLVAAMAALGWSRLQATWRDMSASDAMHQRAGRAAEWRAQTQLNVTRTLALAKSGAGNEITNYLSPQIKQTPARISELQTALEREVDADSGKPLMAEITELRTRYVVNVAVTQLDQMTQSNAALVEQSAAAAASLQQQAARLKELIEAFKLERTPQ